LYRFPCISTSFALYAYALSPSSSSICSKPTFLCKGT
jgi:hypothetical protein